MPPTSQFFDELAGQPQALRRLADHYASPAGRALLAIGSKSQAGRNGRQRRANYGNKLVRFGKTICDLVQSFMANCWLLAMVKASRDRNSRP